MKRYLMQAILIFLLIYMLPLGFRPLIAPDEVRYAEIPREMLDTGDWVVPRLNGVDYFEKPVFGYWINAVSISLLGENAFAVRLPSAVAAALAALALFLFMKRFCLDRLASAFTALIFLTFMEVNLVATINVLDSAFSLFMTGALVLFFSGHMEGNVRKRNAFLALAGVMCGLGFLTKGFIAFAIPLCVVVPFIIWEGRFKKSCVFLAVPAAFACIIALPWSVMVHLRAPDFWNYFFWTEHIHRFFSSGAQHASPFWYFIPVILAGALPWIFLLPSALAGVKKRGTDPIMRFALCWLLLPFIFFSASSGKLGTYILPCYPPLAIVMAMGLISYLEDPGGKLFRGSIAIFILMLGIAAAGLGVMEMPGLFDRPPYNEAETWKWILLIMGLFLWITFLLLVLKTSKTGKKIVLFSAAPLIFMAIAQVSLPGSYEEKKAPGRFLLEHADRIGPDTLIVTNDIERAVCWYYKRNDVYVLGGAGELTYGMKKSGSRLLDMEGLADLISESGPKRHVALIIKSDLYKICRQKLPKPMFEDIQARFAFAQF